jgi:cyclic pyranopterin phosphate synthase
MLIDGHNRVVDYLRISVTERCNFRCQYCMPEKPFSWVPHENLLSFEDMFEFVKVAIDEGIKKIRLTGGEPLLRHGLVQFVKLIHDYAPNIDLAITTNAFLLEETAQSLKDAGLKRLNISLDSLKPEVAKQIAQKDVLDKVLKGIHKANSIGLGIKINCVPLKGINDSEIIDLLEYCKKNNWEIRFIEFMENSHASVKQGLSSDEMQEIISKKYKFTKGKRVGSSPSQTYILEDGYKFGIIEPHKDDFCSDCNRIRITAEGYLIPCLYFEDALSIADAIKQKDIKEASNILKKVLKNKPEKNKWGSENQSNRAFYETGG